MDDTIDMSWLPPGIDPHTFQGRYDAFVIAARAIMEALGFVPICPERGCARARRCCGPVSVNHFANPPCFRQYREEVRFLLASPVGLHAVVQFVAGMDDPGRKPIGPGVESWLMRVLAFWSAPPVPGPKPHAIDALYGSSPEARARLRRPKDVRSTVSWESNLDRFAGYMASGDWRVPLMSDDPLNRSADADSTSRARRRGRAP
jgi:hypothetical protein